MNNKIEEMSIFSKRLQFVQGRDEFIKRHPEIAYAAKKKFETDHPEESSANSHVGVDHVLFYDAFSKYPVELEGHIPVQPKYWAKAFMEFDIKKCTEILCKSIFTSDELLLKKSKGHEKLSYVKKLAIVRAVEWMKNKNQDPWNYKPCAFPSEDDMEIMDGVFQSFNEVYPASPPIPEIEDQIIRNHASKEEIIGECIKGMDLNDFNYTKVFFKVVDLGTFQTASMTVREMTLIAIPYNDDVFVDGVQFSNGRWCKAYRYRDVVKMADILFRKTWKVDGPFYTLEDIPPIKKLAIIRAVAWMKKKDWNEVLSFDPSIPEHNTFLSQEEIQNIDSKFSEYLCRDPQQIVDVGKRLHNVNIVE